MFNISNHKDIRKGSIREKKVRKRRSWLGGTKINLNSFKAPKIEIDSWFSSLLGLVSQAESL